MEFRRAAERARGTSQCRPAGRSVRSARAFASSARAAKRSRG